MYKNVAKILSSLTKPKLIFEKHPLISNLSINDEHFQQRINYGAEINVQLSDECTDSTTIMKTLNDVFKLSTFRTQQLRTITAVLSKKDVLMIAPSGKNMQRNQIF